VRIGCGMGHNRFRVLRSQLTYVIGRMEYVLSHVTVGVVSPN